MGDAMKHLPQVSVLIDLPTRRESSNVRRVLSDKLTLSEAIKASGDLLNQFPNAKSHTDGFIGALAQVLMDYPRQTVGRCTSVRTGLARSAEFISIASVVSWCERDVRPLQEQVARADRIAAQFRDRDEYLREQQVDRAQRPTCDQLNERYGDGKGGWLGEGGPRRKYTEVEKAALIESARQAGKDISNLKLSEATLALLWRGGEVSDARS